MDLISVLISLRMPVTPREDTQYTKPSAVFANHFNAVSDVGAIKDTTSTPCLLATLASSPFSSNGISGTITPEIPTLFAEGKEFSRPNT